MYTQFKPFLSIYLLNMPTLCNVLWNSQFSVAKTYFEYCTIIQPVQSMLQWGVGVGWNVEKTKLRILSYSNPIWAQRSLVKVANTYQLNNSAQGHILHRLGFTFFLEKQDWKKFLMRQLSCVPLKTTTDTYKMTYMK